MDAKAQIKQIEVGGAIYNVALCSAVKQRSIMFLLAKYGLQEMIRRVVMAGNKTSPAQMAIMGLSIVGVMMERMSEAEFNGLCNDVLYKAFAAGSDKPATIDDFQNRMDEYMLLVFRAAGANFEGFGRFLSQMGVSDDGAAQEQTSTQVSTGS
jgi:hypothetical protein